jgi:hypothetical protein
MARISRARVKALLSAGDAATVTSEKGRALEELICYVFGRVPGISVTRRNALNVFHTEEVDVAFWNEQEGDGLPFLPNILLVECKNWSSAVSSEELAWFDRKIQDRGQSFGILVAAGGVTGAPEERTRAHSIIAGALRERRQLVVITRKEIEALADTTQLVRLIKEKLCDLAVVGTILP